MAHLSSFTDVPPHCTRPQVTDEGTEVGVRSLSHVGKVDTVEGR